VLIVVGEGAVGRLAPELGALLAGRGLDVAGVVTAASPRDDAQAAAEARKVAAPQALVVSVHLERVGRIRGTPLAAAEGRVAVRLVSAGEPASRGFEVTHALGAPGVDAAGEDGARQRARLRSGRRRGAV
jgi:hypothetical protein